ncbi:unnamed protein product [Malus baccata var. baccata]
MPNRINSPPRLQISKAIVTFASSYLETKSNVGSPLISRVILQCMAMRLGLPTPGRCSFLMLSW